MLPPLEASKPCLSAPRAANNPARNVHGDADQQILVPQTRVRLSRAAVPPARALKANASPFRAIRSRPAL